MDLSIWKIPSQVICTLLKQVKPSQGNTRAHALCSQMSLSQVWNHSSHQGAHNLSHKPEH